MYSPPRLCGYPPFSNDFKEYSLDNQICNARYQFHQAYWKDISDEGTCIDYLGCLQCISVPCLQLKISSRSF